MWLEMELKRLGHAIIRIVDNGPEAIAFATEAHPDFVLMDIRLAGTMDGVEAARVIVAKHQCSIIFMSGYPQELVRIQEQPFTSAGFLPKPVQIGELERLLDARG